MQIATADDVFLIKAMPLMVDVSDLLQEFVNDADHIMIVCSGGEISCLNRDLGLSPLRVFNMAIAHKMIKQVDQAASYKEIMTHFLRKHFQEQQEQL